MEEEKKVSINSATAEELQNLYGIGEKKAKAIVDYRKEHGKFKSTDEIKNVKGIGKATFSKIEDRITILSKRQLKNKKIKTKYEKKKRVIAHKTKEGINKIKTFIGLKANKAFVATQVGVLTLINKARLKGKNIKKSIHSGIGKVKSVPGNVWKGIKEKFANFKSKFSEEKLQATRDKIAQLKAEKERLVNDLFPSAKGKPATATR